MFKFYVVPDATKLGSHSAIYSAENMKLFWDPRSESDAYAVVEAKGKAEINKASSLEFSILPTNVCYNDFHKKKSVVLAYDDDKLIFEGEVSTNPRDFYKQRRITCTDPLTYLAGSIQPPDEKNEVVVPEAASGTLYVKVPLIWYEDGNPKKLEWRERSQNSTGELVYKVSNDTTANPDKVYYYPVESSGENVSGTTITQKAATEETIQAHISRILSVHNTQVDPFRQIFPGTIDTGDSSEHEFSSTGWRTSWDAFNSDVLEDYGKYVKITTGNNGTLLLNYMDIKQMSSAMPVIEYTHNMIEMTESTDNNDDIFTVLVPIGKDNLTVSAVSGHDSGGDNNEVDPYIASWGGAKRYVVVSKKAVARYGYIVRTQTFSDIDSADELYDKAVKYIKNNYDYHTEYDVKAIDLKVLGETDHRITVGDKCHLKSTWHGVDESDLFVISAQYDYINPENDSFKLGIPTSDREAGNRRLSGQTNNNKKSNSENESNNTSSAGRLSSILENYIHVTEWGLEINSRLKNEVESADKKYKTRFIQDEEHINLAAEKLFGIDKDGRGDKDAGYVKVLKSEYRDGDGPYKNPVTEHWFEKKNDEYVLSTDTTCDPSVVGNKTYYVQRLWSRYSDIDVGEGGIKARVDGNYERSIASSSWIHANEDSIMALTGHIFVDEDGHAYVSSGDGMRTDHQENSTDQKRFMLVPSTMYKDVHGNDVKPNWSTGGKKWYEKKVDTSGAWVGLDKEDAYTNAAYFVYSQDETVKRSKSYYYQSYIREEFRSEFGVYDENNLTAGIIVRSINNPTYHRVSKDRVDDAIKNNTNLAQLMWYVYDNNTGLYGVPPDQTAVPSMALYKSGEGYYERVSNDQTYTNVMGDHVVIGGRLDEDGNPIIFDGVDEATKARIQQYMTRQNLDGTVTEIASDVLYAKAIITNYINVLSTKLFGESNDDDDFVVVKAAGVSSRKNPSANGWYEYSAETGKYFLSADAKAVASKTYYITKLTSRTTDFEVGEGGLQATIKGNYDRSIASQAWIKANEDKIEMLLGHVGEDENGNLVIDSGAGFKTGHSAASAVTPRYVLVLRSQYAGANPKSLGWKERKIGTDGRWIGAGKADSDTNASYYVTTSDTSADYTKQYFIRSTTAETYTSEYGVYDQGNLTAGVVAQMVNHPKYHTIERKYQSANVNPSTASSVKLSNGSTVDSMWYVYDSEHGTYGRTTDTSLVSGRVYYYVQNSTSTYTDLRGEHIVIGTSDGYDDLDAATQTRVNKYIHEHNLDGTITQIASDVVVVNALFAKFLSFDDAEGVVLNAHLINTHSLVVHSDGASSEDGAGWITADGIDVDDVAADKIGTDHIYIGEIGFGSYTGEQATQNETGVSPGDIIIGFGAIKTEGDKVKIPYKTAQMFMDGTEFEYETNVLSFDKPASLGTVTWSSGEKLTVKTAGGKTFFTADLLIPKVYAGNSVSYAKDVDGKIAPNTSLRNKHILSATMDVTGTWTDLQLDQEEDDPVVWTATIYFDATKAYNAGYDTGYGSVGTYCEYDDDNDGEIEGHSTGKISLNYSDSVTVYGRHQPVGGSWRNAGTNDRITITSPADRYETGKTDGRSGTSISAPASTTAPKGVTPTVLSYGTTYEVHKMFGGKSDGGAVYFTAPTNNDATVSGRTYAKYGDTEYTSGTIELGYSSEVTVNGQYKKNDGTWTDVTGIKITSPADNSSSISKSDIKLFVDDTYQSEPSADAVLTDLKGAVEEAISNKYWVKFHISVGGVTKYFKMDFTS